VTGNFSPHPCIQTVSGVTEVLSLGGKSGRVVKLTTHPYLV